MIIWDQFEANGTVYVMAENIPVLVSSVICSIHICLRHLGWFRLCLI